MKKSLLTKALLTFSVIGMVFAFSNTVKAADNYELVWSDEFNGMHVPDFVEGHYNTLFIPKHQDMLKEWAGKKEEETENIAMIAAYIDYLMNLEENKSASSDNRPISRWREFGLQKGVLRI